MIKKLVTGTLILMVTCNPSSAIYAIDNDNLVDNENMGAIVQQLDINEEEPKVEFISPTFGPDQTVVIDSNKKLLISTKVYSNTAVTLSVYKVEEESEELLFEPKVIEPEEELSYTAFIKEIKDIEPGNYKMEFKKSGEEESFKTVNFKVITTEEILKEDEKVQLPNFLDLFESK